MISAKALSAAIRSKRKKLKEDGVENMIDTAPGPQMNPQDIHNLKMKAQYRETMDISDPPEGESDPANAEPGESQDVSALKKKMSRLARILDSLSIG